MQPRGRGLVTNVATVVSARAMNYEYMNQEVLRVPEVFLSTPIPFDHFGDNATMRINRCSPLLSSKLCNVWKF
jgi:hypothetical protein